MRPGEGYRPDSRTAGFRHAERAGYVGGPAIAEGEPMSDGTSQPPAEVPRIVVVPRGQVVVRPGEVERSRQIAHQVAWFLDSSFEIPGTRYRIGFDPLIGLIPVLGDLISMLIGSYIVVLAARLGVPRVVVLRMLVNLG